MLTLPCISVYLSRNDRPAGMDYFDSKMIVLDERGRGTGFQMNGATGKQIYKTRIKRRQG